MPLNYSSELEKYRRYYQKFDETFSQSKQQSYTTTIFSFLVVSLFGWYAIRPTIETILFLQRQISDNKIVSQQMEDKIGKLIDAQAAYQKVENKLPLLAAALPKDPSVINIAVQLKSLGAISQASVSAINISQVPLVAGIATPSGQTPSSVRPTLNSALSNRQIVDTPINIVLEGTYPHLLTFLNGMTKLRRIITINSISLTPNSESNIGLPGIVQLRLILKATAHYLQ